MEPLVPLSSIPQPRRINRRLPDNADEHDKDLEQDARTNDPDKQQDNKNQQRDDDGNSGWKHPKHHRGAQPNLGKHLDLDA